MCSSLPARSVVRWKENPIPSSSSNSRALCHPSDFTLRSLARISLSFRIIMVCLLVSGGDAEFGRQLLPDRMFDDIEPCAQQRIVNDEWGENLDDLVAGAAGFDDQALGEAVRGYGRRGLAGADVDPAHHSAPANGEAMLLRHARKPVLQQFAATGDVILERVVRPEVVQGGRGGDEGMIVAAEGAVVFAGRPHIEFGAEQREGKGQPHA